MCSFCQGGENRSKKIQKLMLQPILKVMDLSSCPSRAPKFGFVNVRTRKKKKSKPLIKSNFLSITLVWIF